MHLLGDVAAVPPPPPLVVDDDPVVRVYDDGSVDVLNPEDDTVWHVERVPERADLTSPPVELPASWSPSGRARVSTAAGPVAALALGPTPTTLTTI